MVKPRLVADERTDDELTIEVYDRMQRSFRDKSWLGTEQVIKAGIDNGLALEVGPGPGYLGLEWLKKTESTNPKGLDISQGMVDIAMRNAGNTVWQGRASFELGDALHMPFADGTFDALFCNLSLHEWSDPEGILSEMYRVLKPGGRYFISDLRRDLNPLTKWFVKAMVKPKEMRPGVASSFKAAYTKDEVEAMLSEADMKGCRIRNTFDQLIIIGQKPDAAAHLR